VTDRSRAAKGLSPRARGNLRQCTPARKDGRSIPACAGEPSWLLAPWVAMRVYPRVRGGTTGTTTHSAIECGLSPRARGNLANGYGAIASQRSIPACAGEPHQWAPERYRHRVYPRVRGGTSSGIIYMRDRSGLSPRARGNRLLQPRDIGKQGSIPACAGEPLATRTCRRRARVYPRVRGGTACAAGRYRWRPGLSPRARGNPAIIFAACLRFRSIPACAGEPESREPAFRRCAVYPRVRGGTRCRRMQPSRDWGLSPRARGNLMVKHGRCWLMRSIPACAGEPRSRVRGNKHGAVYPRVRGGTICAIDHPRGG